MTAGAVLRHLLLPMRFPDRLPEGQAPSVLSPLSGLAKPDLLLTKRVGCLRLSTARRARDIGGARSGYGLGAKRASAPHKAGTLAVPIAAQISGPNHIHRRRSLHHRSHGHRNRHGLRIHLRRSHDHRNPHLRTHHHRRSRLPRETARNTEGHAGNRLAAGQGHRPPQNRCNHTRQRAWTSHLG